MKKKFKTLGLSGEKWIERLEKGGYKVGDYAKQLLLSKDFKPTKKTYEIAIIKATEFEGYPTTQEILAEAKKRGYGNLPADLAPLLRESISDTEIDGMGLWSIVVMHEPINDSVGRPDLLGARRYGDGPWLFAYWVKPDDTWSRDSGFAFAVSQVGTRDSETKNSLDPLPFELRLKKLEETVEKLTKIINI
jgi:hypothetical protein